LVVNAATLPERFGLLRRAGDQDGHDLRTQVAESGLTMVSDALERLGATTRSFTTAVL
jgi:hypothetical protein